MIVRFASDHWLVITQPDHAHFAAELLGLWREPALVDHPRRAALLRAVRLHDNGWREEDAAPRVDPRTGRPYTFHDLPRELRLALWRRGISRYRAADPYVALLVTEHARTLFADRHDDGSLETFRAELDEAREQLLTATGLSSGALREDYRWLDLGDRLSLAVCAGWPGPHRRWGQQARWEREILHLDPFPLAGTTRFEIPGRWVPARGYDGDADFAVTLARARWQELTVRVGPP